MRVLLHDGLRGLMPVTRQEMIAALLANFSRRDAKAHGKQIVEQLTFEDFEVVEGR